MWVNIPTNPGNRKCNTLTNTNTTCNTFMWGNLVYTSTSLIQHNTSIVYAFPQTQITGICLSHLGPETVLLQIQQPPHCGVADIGPGHRTGSKSNYQFVHIHRGATQIMHMVPFSHGLCSYKQSCILKTEEEERCLSHSMSTCHRSNIQPNYPVQLLTT